tara:strand:- start:431 stop:874 length:444 start_codon:yes stop_codon:yes gene_type:complete
MNQEYFTGDDISTKLQTMTNNAKQQLQTWQDSTYNAQIHAEEKLKEQKAILTTLQRQAYIQYDTIMRLDYDRKYAFSFMILFLAIILTLVFSLNRLAARVVMGIIAIYLVIFLIVVIIIAISQKRRRSYSFTTFKFNVDDSNPNSKC